MISKRLPTWLNTDLDERVLGPREMSYAYSVRSMDSDKSDALVLENPKGNLQVAHTLPSGSNRVIGVVEHPERSEFFYCVWNSNADHCIVRFSAVANATKRVMTHDFQWGPYMWVNGFAIYLPTTGDSILCLTDGFNDIWQINVTKAIKREEGDYVNGYSQTIDLRDITLIKAPPLTPPTWEFKTDPDRKVNSIQGKSFEFRARYKYDDFSYSVYGPHSKIAISNWMRQNAPFTVGPYDAESSDPENYLDIEVPTGPDSCTEIEIIARDGNLSEWMVVGTVDNNPEVASVTFSFYNSGNYSVANPQDTEIPFHDVPLSARALTLAEKRAVAGAVVRGLDTKGWSKEEIGKNIRFSPRYLPRQGLKVLKEITLQSSFQSIAFDVFSDDSNWLISSSTQDYYYPFKSGMVIILSVSVTNDTGRSQSLYVEEQIYQGDSNQDVYDRIIIKINQLSLFGVRLYATYYDNWNFQQFPTILISTVTSPPWSYYSINQDAKSGVYSSATYSAHGPTLKSGATAEFAICHSDAYGRRSLSTRIPGGEIYVNHTSERGAFNWQKDGRVILNAVNSMKPPVWAHKWWLEYSGTKSITNSWELIVWSAFAPRNKVVKKRLEDPGDKAVVESINRSIGAGAAVESRTVYVSLGALLGKDISYNEVGGSNTNYAFVKGDRIRVKSIEGDDGDEITDEYIDLSILDVQFLVADTERNPIYNATSEATKFLTTGWFALVESTSNSGFNLSDLTKWEGAVAEIYRPSKDVEEPLFFCTGDVFEIIDAGLDTRRYAGNIRNQGSSISVSVSSTSGNYAQLSTAPTSRPPIVCGDIVDVNGLGFSGLGLEVVGVSLESDTSNNLVWRVYFRDDLPAGSASSISLSNNDSAAIEIETGDYWFKRRWMESLKKKTESNTVGVESFKSIIEVEDKRANDFIGTPSFSKGVANAHSDNDGQSFVPNRIMFGGAFFETSFTNRMNVFNPLEVNFKDLDAKHGAIGAIFFDGNDLLVFKENRVTRIPVGAEIIQSEDGGELRTSSAKFMGPEKPFFQPWGIGWNPESICFDGYRFWFADVRRGVFVRRSEAGLTAISENEFSTPSESLSLSASKYSGKLKVFGGYDRKNREVVWCVQDHSGTPMVIDEEPTVLLYGAEDDGTNVTIPISSGVTPSGLNTANGGAVTFGSETRATEDILENTEDWGVNTIYLDSTLEKGSIYFDSIDELKQAEDIKVTLVVDTSSGKSTLSGTYNYRTGKVSIPKTAGVSGRPDVSLGTLVPGNSFTASYNEQKDKWQGYWPYSVEYLFGMDTMFFSFKNGDMWEHNVNPLRSNFHGTQYSPVFEVSFNDNPSMVKSAMALGIEGTHAWNVAIVSNLGSTTVNSPVFKSEEGMWRSEALLDQAAVTDGNSVGLGVVEDIDSTSIKLTLPILYQMGIHAGLAIHGPLGVINGTVVSFTADTLVMSAPPTNLSVGDFVKAVYPPKSSGNRVKGYYFSARFTLPTADRAKESEVYAVNLDYNANYPNQADSGRSK